MGIMGVHLEHCHSNIHIFVKGSFVFSIVKENSTCFSKKKLIFWSEIFLLMETKQKILFVLEKYMFGGKLQVHFNTCFWPKFNIKGNTNGKVSSFMLKILPAEAGRII